MIILKITFKKKFAGAGYRSGISRCRHQNANALDHTTILLTHAGISCNTFYKPTGSTEKKMTGYRQLIFKAK